MDIRIQAIHFDISEKLTAFINKKVEKLVHRYPELNTIEATLKVVKPETAKNKEVVLQAGEIAATKIANSFEEAVDLALEAIERQLEKRKNK
ncbi:MAG: HPF/RaiA family ribosome-associated protein [Muribaculaceae bacterium]|nr:HPF/RaiA family ribosome-associated protein [Muribaculaceae bacterium]